MRTTQKLFHEMQDHVDLHLADLLQASGWWRGASDENIVKMQFHLAELIMPFNTFREALNRYMGRFVSDEEIRKDFEKLYKQIYVNNTSNTHQT